MPPAGYAPPAPPSGYAAPAPPIADVPPAPPVAEEAPIVDVPESQTGDADVIVPPEVPAEEAPPADE
jgi:hypothetical protein